MGPVLVLGEAMMSMFVIGLIADLVPESYSKQVLGGGTVQSLLAVAAGNLPGAGAGAMATPWLPSNKVPELIGINSFMSIGQY